MTYQVTVMQAAVIDVDANSKFDAMRLVQDDPDVKSKALKALTDNGVEVTDVQPA